MDVADLCKAELTVLLAFDLDPYELWDVDRDSLPGAVNWSLDPDSSDGEHVVVIGPEFADALPQKVDW
ncbi:hypothetical protein F0L68_40630 [Solihabitans fulvus]|uniref:Uncharacterized protein n=1 Tax=Solihabitans fulvus TaxID=1892852 RepID=A0A5B2W843_9PSEU|nr:hypothetical protein [Solihabitans fulvus]KAA2246399.1 hypothetical protein F0L68_40630 [Solihabitans fulvus]